MDDQLKTLLEVAKDRAEEVVDKRVITSLNILLRVKKKSRRFYFDFKLDRAIEVELKKRSERCDKQGTQRSRTFHSFQRRTDKHGRAVKFKGGWIQVCAKCGVLS